MRLSLCLPRTMIVTPCAELRANAIYFVPLHRNSGHNILRLGIAISQLPHVLLSSFNRRFIRDILYSFKAVPDHFPILLAILIPIRHRWLFVKSILCYQKRSRRTYASTLLVCSKLEHPFLLRLSCHVPSQVPCPISSKNHPSPMSNFRKVRVVSQRGWSSC